MILNTARISASNKRIRSGDALSQGDRDLLYHLLKHNHGTPFERLYFQFRVILPQFVMKQWIRHRICSFNEYSMRYRTGIQSFYVPGKEARKASGFEVMTDEETREYGVLLRGLYEWYSRTYEKMNARIKEAEEKGLIPKLSNEGGAIRIEAVRASCFEMPCRWPHIRTCTGP